MNCNKNNQGFTLVELGVVIVIVGALLTLGFQLLRSVWTSELTGSSPLQLEGLFTYARDHALARGKVLSLVVNLDKKTMGLRPYRPDLEQAQDASLRQLWENRNAYLLPKDEKEELAEEAEENEVPWIVEPTDLPAGIDKMYSVSGIQLSGPIIFVHFYPNATSDSVIFHFEGRELPYLLLTSQNAPARYLKNISFDESGLPSIDER